MPISSLLLGALAVLPGQEAQETKPELLQFAQLARLPLEPAESPLGRSVFVVGKRTTNGSTFVAAVDGTTGERRWKFETEGRPAAHGSLHAIQSSRGARLLIRRARSDLLAPQTWIVLDANDGKLLRELTLPASETCVALELEPEGKGSCTTFNSAGMFRRTDLRTGDVLASGGHPGIPSKPGLGAQLPDETGDGVPELISLAEADCGPNYLSVFDGVSLERLRSEPLPGALSAPYFDESFCRSLDLAVVSTPKGVRLLATTKGSAEARHALVGVSLTGFSEIVELPSGEPMVLADASLAWLRLDYPDLLCMRATFASRDPEVRSGRPLGEVVLPQHDSPWSDGSWAGWSTVHRGDTTLWVAFPIGSRRGDEPVLAAWDVATGREVWKSENLLR